GGAKGSKIVVTTRSKWVATTVGTVPIYNLESHSDEDCHELLLKWAGCREKLGEEHDGIAKLSEIAKEIVKKCHGCPLAAKTLGNSLFMETDESKWLDLKEKELWELAQKKHDILGVLRSSYNSLPTDLKRCFIYCSIFPKSYKIEIDKLIQLWMAQGIIKLSGLNRELEDTGIDYLGRLCSIFFLEKIEKQHGNLSNTCRMHEIIHDLAVFMANGECLSTANYHSGSIFERVKHVSFLDCDCSGKEGVTKSLFELENLRTILFPFQGVGAGDNQGFVNRCISKFKYLHVLDFSNSCLKVLPDSIGNLKHLRFLDLSGNANIETLPNAICRLYNLQTLRIWNCVKIRELPKKIGNLISLRHLYLTTQQSCLPEKEIQQLTSLRSFHIIGCENLTYLPEEMQLLTALTTVTSAACPNLTSLPNTMQKLANLRNWEISKCPNLNLAGWEDFRGLRRLQ
ncbi:putative disease resistance protein RGA3, partial [Camellia sinensis]|uniref:putative disease resistance protein RGA3 n=1 Tax=Camellia sinensis TaxID=4442 RepID=UPI001036E59F